MVSNGFSWILMDFQVLGTAKFDVVIGNNLHRCQCEIKMVTWGGVHIPPAKKKIEMFFQQGFKFYAF